MREAEDKLPESDLKVAPNRVPLHKVNKSRLPLQIVKCPHKLLMQQQIVLILNPSLEVQISLVIAVKRPMILVERAHRHVSTIVHLNCFHVQVLKRLFVDNSTLRA